MWRELGATVVDADQVARDVMQLGSPALPALSAAFGEDILYNDGSLNRSLLAERAFVDAEHTEQLNDIVQPILLLVRKNYWLPLRLHDVRYMMFLFLLSII